MTRPGRLHLPRVRSAPLLLLLGMLLDLLSGAQGLPGVGLPPSASQAAHQHFTQGTLKPAAHLVGKHPSDLPDIQPPSLLLPTPRTQEPKHPPPSPSVPPPPPSPPPRAEASIPTSPPPILQDLSRLVCASSGTETSEPPDPYSPSPWLFLGDPSIQNSLRWRANTDHAFLHHGFSLSNNSLLVPTSGLYFVYSQVVFSGKGCSPKATTAPLYLAHEIQLFSSRYPFHVPLLSAQKSVCPGPQGPWVRSVYQGAVFLLTQGDQLSTHTDGISHLFLSPSSVFFGAFAL